MKGYYVSIKILNFFTYIHYGYWILYSKKKFTVKITIEKMIL